MSKVVLKIIGVGWKTNINVEIENGKISFDKKEFDEVMNLISMTHDGVGGGFLIKEETK